MRIAEQNVPRLDVAVDDASLVRVVQCGSNLSRDVPGFLL